MDIPRFARSVVALTLVAAIATPAFAAPGPSDTSAKASELSVQTLSAATGILVVGSLSAITLSGRAVVQAVEASGDAVSVTLKSVGDASAATVRLSARAVEGLGFAVGSVVMVSATATGTVLVAAGRVIGFIANDAGRALIRSQRVGPKPLA